MITERDLQEAIAECEGVRNPNASTCIKLAAFYTIKKELFGSGADALTYSYAPPPAQDTGYVSDTEFGEIVSGMDLADVMGVVDELMTTLAVVNPRLYDGVMRKLNTI